MTYRLRPRIDLPVEVRRAVVAGSPPREEEPISGSARAWLRRVGRTADSASTRAYISSGQGLRLWSRCGTMVIPEMRAVDGSP
ncbi:hypothetical protein [Streptomyces geranii]|uniref:hypothetical protein n=1 Tax=Streptomyces geranii TaxID=2058923 RepID=UPI001E401485|nr:hypothetical protein [Streptomyces geranii]